MTNVKICGLKDVNSVQAAVEAGADLIGFVFAKSKRQVSVAEAQQLAMNVPQTIVKVGVFVDEPLDSLLEIAKQVPLDCIQLHGNETNAYIQSIPYPTIKAIGIQTEEDSKKLSEYKAATYMLVDAPIAGSGETFAWQLLKDVQRPIIVAGGLHADNVAEAIRILNPHTVDVSSGVETNGEKDPLKIKQFILKAKQGEMTDDRNDD